MNGSRILLLGLAYKPNTSDARETPATRIAQLLLDMGADLTAVDPHVPGDDFSVPLAQVDLSAEELRRADIVVLLTDHDAFDLDLVAAESSCVLDCRNVVPRGDNTEYL